jgi:hypothetical protein
MTMTSRDLAEIVRDAKTHSKLLSQLDFVNATDAKLYTLFVCGNERVIKRSLSKDKSIIHPPIALRRTAKQIREFYDSGLSQKYELIEKYKFYITNTSGLITFLESDYTSANLPPPGGSPSVAAGSTKSTHSVTFAEDSTFTVDEPPVCGGITIEYINSMKLDAEKRKDRILGFKHTVREGWFTREQLEHPTNNIGFSWPFCLPVVSCLTSGNDMNEIFWKIEQIDDRTNHEESPDFDKFVIRHIDCNTALGAEMKQGLCSGCLSRKKSLLDRFDSHVDKRSNTLSTKTRSDVLRIHSLQQEKTKHWMRMAKNYGMRLSYKQRALDKLLEETGVHVEINEAADKIFNETNAERVKQFLESNPHQRGNAIAEYVFKENCQKYLQAKKFGRTSIRHSPLVIRLGALVLSMMGNGGDVYDLVAKACGLPSARTLRNYKSHSVNEPDGILYSQLEAARELFNEKHGDSSPTSWQRSIRLAWDEMTVKGRFSVNHHTGKLIGIANDAFESSIIAREWAALAEKGDEKEDEEIVVPETTKHFLAVIATTMKAGYKQHIFVARYGVKKTNFEFLARRLPEISCALYDYGFVVRLMGNDGATENRAVTKILANISARDVLSTKWTAAELKGLNLDFKIAFKHPSPACRDVKIFFGSDMPHLVKKIRNAMDNKSRELIFRDNDISLKMVESIWRASESGAGHLRTTHLGVDHFQLDSYKKMRVFLAVQVMSQSTIRMIKNYCAKNSDADINEYQGMIEIFEKVDRLVDICNARGAAEITKVGTARNTYKINSPRHEHLKDLFDVLRLFEEWKVEAGGFTKHFVTKQTYEDLLWTVYGIAGVAVEYLEEDGSKEFDQSVSGSDCCEHFFTGIKQDCSNPTLGQANQAAGKRTALNAVTGGNQFKSKRGGSNSIGLGVDAKDYVAPIIKPSKKRRSAK